LSTLLCDIPKCVVSLLVEPWFWERGPAVLAFFLEGLACPAVVALDESGVGGRVRGEGGLFSVRALNP